MYIDKNKILQSKLPKQSEINKKFNILKENDTTQNRIHFMENFRNQSNSIILENLKYMYTIPAIGTSFLNHFVKTSRISADDLQVQKESLVSFIDKLNHNNYVNYSHLDELQESVSLIESLIQERNSTEYLKADTIVQLNIRNIRKYCTLESYLADDIDVIINNINYNPETIDQYEKLLRDIKTSKSPAILSSFPMALVKNTELIIGITVPSIGVGLPIISSLPEVIVDKLIEMKVNHSQITSYIKIIDKQIALIYRELKNGDPRKYNMYSTYLGELKEAKNRLSKYNTGLKENLITLESSHDENDFDEDEEPVSEDIAGMQPEITLYEDGVIEDIAADLEDILVDIIFDDSDIVPEETLEQLTRIYLTLEAMSSNEVNIVNEAGAVAKTLIKGAHSAERVANKTVSKIAAAGSSLKRVSTPINKIADPFINFVNKTLDNIKQMDAKERRNRIITGQFRFKLFNTLSKGIAGIATGKLIAAGVAGGAIVSPLLTLIGAITAIAIDKNLDKKQRQNLLKELEGELKIVNEKIEDSRGDENKEKKYQLMRIQQKLEKDIERVRYHLD